jgi:hypothetical protein
VLRARTGRRRLAPRLPGRRHARQRRGSGRSRTECSARCDGGAAPNGFSRPFSGSHSSCRSRTHIRSSKPARRSSPPLGWFDSIAAPWRASLLSPRLSARVAGVVHRAEAEDRRKGAVQGIGTIRRPSRGSERRWFHPVAAPASGARLPGCARTPDPVTAMGPEDVRGVRSRPQAESGEPFAEPRPDASGPDARPRRISRTLPGTERLNAYPRGGSSSALRSLEDRRMRRREPVGQSDTSGSSASAGPRRS